MYNQISYKPICMQMTVSFLTGKWAKPSKVQKKQKPLSDENHTYITFQSTCAQKKKTNVTTKADSKRSWQTRVNPIQT